MVLSLLAALCVFSTGKAFENASSPQEQRALLSKRPNFVFFFAEGWRYDWDGRPTAPEVPLKLPFLKSLVKQGVSFSQAYSPSPLCVPSRAALSAGREYDYTDVSSMSIDYPGLSLDNMPTFFRLLKTAGYHVMTAGKDHLTQGTNLGCKVNFEGCKDCLWGDGRYHQEELGFSDGYRGVDKWELFEEGIPADPLGYYLHNASITLRNGTVMNRYDILQHCYEATALPDEICNSDTYGDEGQVDVITTEFAKRLLRRRPRDRPFFMNIAYLNAHEPHVVTADMRASVADRVFPNATDDPNNIGGGGTCAAGGVDGNYSRCNYAAFLEKLDGLFQQVLDEIEEQGELHETIVIFSSDHGEMLGDYGRTGKSLPLQGAAAVPLVISGPGISGGIEIPTPVANLDIPGTILDLAGVEKAPNMTTRSLRPLWESGPGSYRDYVSSGLDSWRMVVKDINGTSYKYVGCFGDCLNGGMGNSGTEWHQLLYDVTADPTEEHDLSGERPEIVEALCRLLPTDSYKGDFTSGCGTQRRLQEIVLV